MPSDESKFCVNINIYPDKESVPEGKRMALWDMIDIIRK